MSFIPKKSPIVPLFHRLAGIGAKLANHEHAPEINREVGFPPITASPTWDVTGDLEAMYTAHRGAPVSSTPHVCIMSAVYREDAIVASICDASRMAVENDLEAHGIHVERSGFNGDSLVQRMRQRSVHRFLKSPCTHMLFWDLDIEAIDPTCVRKMLATGYDVVAGACPRKSMVDRRIVCNLWPEDHERLINGETAAFPKGCIEVQDAGTGFMLISRKALIDTMQAHPELLHWSRSVLDLNEPLWAIFDTGVVDGVYQSEDFMFCRHWQQLGGKVYVYVPAAFRHYGTHGYEGSFVEQYGLVARGPDSS